MESQYLGLIMNFVTFRTNDKCKDIFYPRMRRDGAEQRKEI